VYFISVQIGVLSHYFLITACCSWNSND